MQNGEPAGDTEPVIDWPGHAAAPPGPVTLTAIRDTDPARLSPSELVDAINCSERLISHLTGLQTSLLTEFAPTRKVW